MELGAEIEIGIVAKNFREVFEPVFVDDGAMGYDYRFGEVHALYDFEGAKSLAESGLGVPEKIFAAAGEMLDGALNRLKLFGSEVNVVGHFVRNGGELALDGFDGVYGGVEVELEPFAPFGAAQFRPVLFQDAVDVIIAKRLLARDGERGVFELVFNVGGGRVLLDSFVSGGVQGVAVRRQQICGAVGRYGGVADFEASFVRGVGD